MDLKNQLPRLNEGAVMRNAYPLSPLVGMILVFSCCTVLGFLSGYNNGEVIGMGFGIVIGMALCIIMAAEEHGREESVWRQNSQTQAQIRSIRNLDSPP